MTARARQWPIPRLGVTYYPELRPEDAWAGDAAAIREAGLTLVRLGEFAWTRLEPEPGRFELDWLERALDALAGAGLEFVLCTPTAQPPSWLYERAPGIRRTRADGRVVPFAMEARYCPLAPALHEAADRIVSALGARFGPRPDVVGWQVDNEISSPCWCERCREAFRDYLRARYATLDELNRRLGTVFRNETYTSWEQLDLPDDRVAYPNPGLAVAARTFQSQTLVAWAARQTRVLREHGARTVTHNLTPPRFPLDLDPAALSEKLDLVSWDNYPSLDPDADWNAPAFEADLLRGLKRGPFWSLEQQAWTVGVESQTTPRPGQTRLWAWQAIAHGAEAVVFFRWQTSAYGAEQGWEGLHDARGRRGRGYEAVGEIACELDALGELATLEPVVDAAVLYDHESRFAQQVQPVNDALAYMPALERHHRALRRLAVGVDVLPVAHDLSPYRIVVAAGLAYVEPDLAARLGDFVRAGGLLVLAPRTAWKDRDGQVPPLPLPAHLAELAGVEVTDYSSRPIDDRTRFTGALEGELAGWTEELALHGADPLAHFADGPFAGSPAIAQHAVGSGTVIVVAGALTDDAADALYAHLTREAGLETLSLPPEVEAVRVRAAGEDALLLLNHGAHPARALDVADLAAYGWALLQRPEGRRTWIPLS